MQLACSATAARDGWRLSSSSARWQRGDRRRTPRTVLRVASGLGSEFADNEKGMTKTSSTTTCNDPLSTTVYTKGYTESKQSKKIVMWRCPVSSHPHQW